MQDSVWGRCQFDGVEAWQCSRVIETPHSPTTRLVTRVWLYDDSPTELQETRFADLVENYDQLWPEVARVLATLHPGLTTVEEVQTHVRDDVAVHVGEHEEGSVELIYEFNLPDEGTRGFFLRIDGRRVIDAIIAD